MLNVTEYSAELVKDPFGILTGARYEFILDLDVPEDDELHSEGGVYIRAIYRMDGEEGGLVKYDLVERSTNKLLDVDLEPEEEAELAGFCRSHLPEA